MERAHHDSTKRLNKQLFFIVGVPKAGTTSLQAMLNTHPDIYMPPRKELYYYCPDFHSDAVDGALSDRVPQSHSDFCSIFANRDESTVGEATPFYLASEKAPYQLCADWPDARYIAILREPVSTLYSRYRHLRSWGLEPAGTFAAAMRRDRTSSAPPEPPYSLMHNTLAYRRFVQYTDQLERFRSVVGDSSMTVLFLDDLADRADKTLNDLQEFLGVEPVDLTDDRRSNPFSRPYARSVMTAVRATRPYLYSLLPPDWAASVYWGLYHASQYRASKPPMDEDVNRKLKREFAPMVHELATNHNRDLVEQWKYDDL